MKIIVLAFFLLIASGSFGQWTKDTMVLYNGRHSAMRMEFDRSSEKIKATIFYENGKPQTIYYYDGNKAIRWVAYDTSGLQISAWQDPEIEQSKERLGRGIAFSIVFVLLFGVVLLLYKKQGYDKAYISIAYVAVLVTIFTHLIQNKIDLEHINKVFLYGFGAVVLCMPVSLFLLSIINFLRKSKIPLLVTILLAIFSLWLSMLYIFSMLTAGIMLS